MCKKSLKITDKCTLRIFKPFEGMQIFIRVMACSGMQILEESNGLKDTIFIGQPRVIYDIFRFVRLN